MNNIQKRAFALDNAVIYSVLLMAALARSVIELHYELNFANALDAAVAGIVFSISIYSTGCYELRNIGTGVDETRLIIQGATRAFLIIGTLSFVFRREPSRFVLFIGFIVGLSLLVAGRKYLLNKLYEGRDGGKDLRKAIILGSSQYADELTATLNSLPHYGLKVVGRLGMHGATSLPSKQNWLNTIDQSIKHENVEVIIVEDSEDTSQDLLNALSWHLNDKNVEVLIAMSFIHSLGPRLNFTFHHELPLMYIDEPKLSPINRFLKRTLDIVISSIAALVFLPIMIIVCIAILVTNGGPIFFTQDRIGLSGKNFKFIKFRSMVVGAEQLREEVLGLPDDEMADRYKNDPRIFPVGKVLRRFSLDELPQLFSVIKGDMSLVGPRPLLVDEVDLLGDSEHRRHLTKPGLTGLWQVSGRKETTWDERIRLDLHYVHNWTIGLDAGILLKTIKVIATGHGSY
jgi:exopolysaccharide biosynthesis polyprenyl glycosylphosphotransferase